MEEEKNVVYLDEMREKMIKSPLEIPASKWFFILRWLLSSAALGTSRPLSISSPETKKQILLLSCVLKHTPPTHQTPIQSLSSLLLLPLSKIFHLAVKYTGEEEEEMGEERGEEMGEMVDLDILSSIQECFQSVFKDGWKLRPTFDLMSTIIEKICQTIQEAIQTIHINHFKQKEKNEKKEERSAAQNEEKIRSVLGCLCVVLAKYEKMINEQSNTQKIFKVLCDRLIPTLLSTFRSLSLLSPFLPSTPSFLSRAETSIISIIRKGLFDRVHLNGFLTSPQDVFRDIEVVFEGERGGKGKGRERGGKGEGKGKKKEIYLRCLFDCLSKCVQTDLESLPLLASLPPTSSSSSSPLSTPLSFLSLFFSLFLDQFAKIQKEEELHYKRRTGKVRAITTTSAPPTTEEGEEGEGEKGGEEGMMKELMMNSSVVPFWFFVSCVNLLSLPPPSARSPSARSCLSSYQFGEEKEEEEEEGRKRKRDEGGRFDLEGESKFALLLATKMEVLKKMLDLLGKTEVFLQQKQQLQGKGGGGGVLWGFVKYLVGMCCGWVEVGQCRMVHLGEVKGEVGGVKGGVKFAERQWEKVGGVGIGCLESVLMLDHNLISDELAFIWRYITPFTEVKTLRKAALSFSVTALRMFCRLRQIDVLVSSQLMSLKNCSLPNPKTVTFSFGNVGHKKIDYTNTISWTLGDSLFHCAQAVAPDQSSPPSSSFPIMATPQRKRMRGTKSNRKVVESVSMCPFVWTGTTSPAIFVDLDYLTAFGEAIERHPVTLIQSAVTELIEECDAHLRNLFREKDHPTGPIAQFFEFSAVCQIGMLLNVALEKIAVTTSSESIVRSLTENVVGTLLSPHLGAVLSMWRETIAEGGKSEKGKKGGMGGEEVSRVFCPSVLASVMTMVFHSTVRLYENCFHFESEAEAKRVGSVAETGYFGYIAPPADSDSDSDSDAEMEDEAPVTPLPTLFELLDCVSALSPQASSCSPALLRCRLTLLITSVHMLQEALRIDNEDVIRRLVSYILSDIACYQPYLEMEEKEEAVTFASFNQFWCSPKEFVLMHWGLVGNLLCCFDSSSPALMVQDREGGEGEWKGAFGEVARDPKVGFPPSFDNFLLGVLMNYGVGSSSSSKEMEDISWGVLGRAQLFEKKGVREFFVAFVRNKVQNIVESSDEPNVSFLAKLCQFLSYILHTHTAWEVNEIIPLFLDISQLEIFLFPSVSSDVEKEQNLIILTRQLLHDLSLLAPLWTPPTTPSTPPTTTIPFLSFAEYYTTSTFAYSLLLKESKLTLFSTISGHIWTSYCQALCQRMKKGKGGEEEGEGWLEEVCECVVGSVEKVFGEDVSEGVTGSFSVGVSCLEIFLKAISSKKAAIDALKRDSKLKKKLKNLGKQTKKARISFFGDKPLDLSSFSSSPSISPSLSSKKGKKSTAKKENALLGLSVGDNCLLYTSFTIFELILSKFLELWEDKEEKEGEEEGGRKDILDGLLWSGVCIVSYLCGKEKEGEEGMEVEKCFQSLAKILQFWKDGMMENEGSLFLTPSRCSNFFATLVALMEQLHTLPNVPPHIYRTILDVFYHLFPHLLTPSLSSLPTKLLFELQWNFSPSLSLSLIPSSSPSLSCLPSPSPSKMPLRGFILLLFFARVIFGMSSLPKRARQFLREHLSDVLGTCLSVISERPTEEGLLDVSFPIKMGGLFDLSGSVQVNGEGNQDDNHVSLFFLAIKLINHIVIQKKGAEESPEKIGTILQTLAMSFSSHIHHQLSSSTLSPTLTTTPNAPPSPPPFVFFLQKKEGEGGEDAFVRSCHIFLEVYTLLHGMVQFYFHQLMPHVSGLLVVVRSLFFSFVNLIELSKSTKHRSSSSLLLHCGQNMSRLYALLGSQFGSLGHYVVFILNDFFVAMRNHPIPDDMRKTLNPGLFSLLDVCSEHHLKHLHRSLSSTAQTAFKALHAEYVRSFKYKGKS